MNTCSSKFSFLVLSLLFLLAGCGGDPKLLDIKESVTGEPDTTDGCDGTYNLGYVSGNVVDGSLSNALVYLDINGSEEWEEDEPYTMTDVEGNYKLKADSRYLSKYNLLVVISATTIDIETGKSPGAYTMTYLSPSVRSELNSNLNTHGFSINAFTSMIQDEIEQGVSPTAAVKNIGLLLGLREQYYYLLLVDFWRVKTTGKISDNMKSSADVLKIVNRLHNIARVYARVLSKKLNEVTTGKSYTTFQKRYITHMILDALKQKLSAVMATDDRIEEADILAQEIAQKINTKNIDKMVRKHNFNMPPNRPTIITPEDTFPLSKASGTGIYLSWKMYYGENGSEIVLKKMPENEQVDSRYLSVDTPDVQSGVFRLKLNKESVYSYKVCLKNNNGESCSADFKFKVIR